MPTTSNQELIQIRITARKSAETVMELINQEAVSLPAEGRNAFYEHLIKNLPQSLLPRPAATVEPFTDAQARAWGRNRMQFGQFAGQTIDSISLNYLQKLAEPNDFTRHLRRYLASQRIALEEELAERAEGRSG